MKKKTRGGQEKTLYTTIIALVLKENLHGTTYEKFVEKINDLKFFKGIKTENDLKN
jgi:hypothetical protein